MIDYAVLCQTLADWRAGRRPSLPPSATPTMPGASTAPASTTSAAAPAEAEDSGVIMVEEGFEPGFDQYSSEFGMTDDGGSIDESLTGGSFDGGLTYPGAPERRGDS